MADHRPRAVRLAPGYFLSDIRRIERTLRRGGWVKDGEPFILPHAPFDLRRAYNGLGQMAAANGWIW